MLSLRQSEIFALTSAQKLLLVANYVRVVLKRTVVGKSDWRFNNLSGSHHQSQKESCCRFCCRMNWIYWLSRQSIKWNYLTLIAKYSWKDRFKYCYFVCWIKKNIVQNDIIELLLSDIQWLVKKYQNGVWVIIVQGFIRSQLLPMVYRRLWDFLPQSQFSLRAGARAWVSPQGSFLGKVAHHAPMAPSYGKIYGDPWNNS